MFRNYIFRMLFPGTIPRVDGLTGVPPSCGPHRT